MLSELLSKLQIHPVLVDVGASGEPPTIWEPVRRNAFYVGFDPDQRELRTDQDNGFFKSYIVNAAVVASPAADQVQFYLTKSPFCSSTLLPDAGSLDNYLFAPLFAVEGKSQVSATTLNQVVDRLALPSIDWLKIDTQGTDLRIFQSLSPELQSRALALDVEPGLIDAYQGEDLFADAHKALTRNGFWLSNLDVKTTVRMKRATLSNLNRGEVEQVEYQFEHRLKPAPGWVEARYLRTLEFALDQPWSERDYVLLWAFAILDLQFGFALDTALAFRLRFREDAIARELEDIAWSLATRGSRQWLITQQAKRLAKRLIRYGR